MSPFVSIVFPAHAAGAALLRRSILALRAQTAPRHMFEVIVAVDGPDPDELVDRAVQADRQPFACRVVHSPRTREHRNVPHRNHARAAGCAAARGVYLWPLDADLIIDPLAVEHLHAVTEGGLLHRSVSPCLAEPRCRPEEWLALTEAFVASEDVPSLVAQATSLTLRRWTTSGAIERYARGGPRTMRVRLVEGQPAFPRVVYDALGGYDLRFLAWGGNKIELCRRLRFLDSHERLLEMHLLRSIRFVHQPHPKDPLHRDAAWRARNDALFYGKQAAMERGESWWRDQVDAVRWVVT